MSSLPSYSKDSAALLGKVIVRPICHQAMLRHQQQTQPHSAPPPWSPYHHPQTSTGPAHWLSQEPVIVDPALNRRNLPRTDLAPHADLIELASSTENVSVCGSTSSAEYKSCDEEGIEGESRRTSTNRCGSPVVGVATVVRASRTRSFSADLATVSAADVSMIGKERECCSAASDFGGCRVVGAEDDLEDEDDCFLPDEPYVNVKRFPQCPSATQLSVSSSNSDPTVPTCRICHLSAGEGDRLISPCRCSGTMQHIHSGCLMKWLEVSHRKSKRPPSCELCLYQYHRHKKFKANHWQFPQCSLKDKILHVLFFLSLLTMIGSATVTILCFKQEKGGRLNTLDRNRLTHSEVVTLVCGVLFFVAFFLAMYVEVKARSTIYKLIMDFMYLNQQWYIEEYDKKEDIQSVAV